MPVALHLRVFVSPARAFGDAGGTFAPCTSTLVYGDEEAVLVDAQFHARDVDALGDLIASSHRRLTTIFITHGHGDHYFGSERLAARFPGARVVASPAVVAHMHEGVQAEAASFRALYADEVVVPATLPVPLEGDVIALEGNELHVLNVGPGDVAPSTVLHVPDLQAVIAGDLVYNRTHQMMGFGGPAQWQAWIESVDALDRMSLRTIVAGHRPAEAEDDDVRTVLDTTRSYIRDFAEAVETLPTAKEVVGHMQARYPDHANPSTLVLSARLAVKVRSRAAHTG